MGLSHTPPPPVLAAGAAVVQVFCSRRRPSSRSSRAAAAVVGGASLGLAGLSGLSFLRHHTTISPHRIDGATTLLTTGANRVSRNPIYLAMAGLLLAHAIARRSWLALLPAGGFVWLVTRWQIVPEEAALTEVFDGQYAAYRAQVPRWLSPRSLRSLRSSRS